MNSTIVRLIIVSVITFLFFSLNPVYADPTEELTKAMTQGNTVDIQKVKALVSKGAT